MKICKKIISWIITLCTITAIIPTSALAIQSKELGSTASYVYVNGVKLSNGGYWKNGDTAKATGTASNYNAHLENGTLYLNNAKFTKQGDQAGGITSQGDLHIVLSGTNNFEIHAVPSYAIHVEGSLTISGNGTISNYVQLEADIGTFGGNVGIFASNDITILGGTIIEKVGGIGISCAGTYRQNGGDISTSGVNGGMFVQGNVLMQNGKLYVSSEYQALAAYGLMAISGDSLLVCEDKQWPSLTSLYNNTTGMTMAAGKSESAAKPINNLPADNNYKYIAIYPQTYSTNRFLDVNNTDWFYDSVGYAYNSSITSGTSAVRFSPGLSCTRAQIMQMLWRANGSPELSGTANPFTDVKSSDYFYKAVLWAVKEGITTGTSDTTFSPNNICTRAQAMALLWNAMGQPSASNAVSFADVKPNDYYYNAVKWAVSKGVTSGTSASAFSPTQSCTRAQIVTFIYKAAA